MSLKQEIETWVKALGHYDTNEFDEALKAFDNIADTSKILFNMGVIHATLGEHEKAVDCYQRAIALDKYLAVAYFQQGVSNFLVGDFEEALANFNDTLLYLRGHNNIDYEQLGLKFKLHSCEALFNRGLCYIYLQQKDAGMQDLSYAAREKSMPDHDVIEDAIREEAEGYTVFSIPVGIVYRPHEAKVKNLKSKDYLGRARLVAAADRNNLFTGFAGAEIKAANSTGGKDDRPEEQLSYAATNLVKPNLVSRSNSRLQSEPPMNRNVFPPTPPPEADARPGRNEPLTRAQSVKNGVRPYPTPLDLSVAGFDQRGDPAGAAPKPRAMPQRSASERPRQRDRDYDRGLGRRDTDAGYGDRRREPPRRRSYEADDDRADDGYPDDVYDMYGGRGGGARRSQGRGAGRGIGYIEEEDEFVGSDASEPDFEMVSRSRTAASRRRRASRSRSRGAAGRSFASSSTGGGGGGAALRKIRVKVHGADTRYVLIGPAVEFPDFVDGIRQKFGLRTAFKVMTKDEGGDLITMSDRDDLELAVMDCRREARREGSEMGKMEVWLQEIG